VRGHVRAPPDRLDPGPVLHRALAPDVLVPPASRPGLQTALETAEVSATTTAPVTARWRHHSSD